MPHGAPGFGGAYIFAPSGAQGVAISVCLSVCHVDKLSIALNLCLFA